MKVGQKVILNKGEPTEAYGTFVGFGEMETYSTKEQKKVYLVSLDTQYTGYIENKSKQGCYISVIVAHPDNVKEIIDA